MASYSVTTTAQTVAQAGNRWLVSNAGTANVFIEGGGRTEVVVRTAEAVSLYATVDLTARTSSGTATLTVIDYDSAQDGDTIDGGTP